MGEDIYKYHKVNIPGLFQEVFNNPDCAVLKVPFSVLRDILAEVAKRAIELDDQELHKLMLRLTLYEIANPESPEFNPDAVQRYLEREPKTETRCDRYKKALEDIVNYETANLCLMGEDADALWGIASDALEGDGE
jgi:hypothetical protein